jgi:hypothetical protein
VKTAVVVMLVLGASMCGACGGPPPKMVAAKDDGVPANSASEERLRGSAPAKPVATGENAAQPLMTPMTPSPAKPGATGKVTKEECKQLFDKYIDLTIGGDTRFAGIPPEMVAEMKETALAQAEAQKGDPCSTQDVSRAQYRCAMGSTSPAAWTRCMK